MARKREIEVPGQMGLLRVVAQVAFVDALTGRSYRPGDVVEGWPYERARLYESRGTVRIESGSQGIGPREVK